MSVAPVNPLTFKSQGVSALMLHVLLAAVPGSAALLYFFGWGVLFNLISLILWALLLEAAILRWRGRDVLLHLCDLSAVVTAVLLALALPPTAPWWLGLIGIFFAIVVAKQLYGGLGYNLFNPAMVGYAVLLVAFPVQMTRWLLPQGATIGLPGFGDAVTIFAAGELLQGIDAYVGATALDNLRQQQGTQFASELEGPSQLPALWAAPGWEWINSGFLFGGAYLLFKRVISWHIPVSMLLTLALLAWLFHINGRLPTALSPLFHLFSGATMFGAFFIATDPVTAAATPRGKLLYGALIGAGVFVIRSFGNYPDGVAFSVLLGNLTAPLIDRMTTPRRSRHSR